MSTTEATMAAIERFNDAFNQHDVDGLTRLMTDDVEARIQTDGEVAGPGRNAAFCDRTPACGLGSGGANGSRCR